MGTAAIVAIIVVVAVLIIILSHQFSRTKRRASPFFLQSSALCKAASKHRFSEKCGLVN